MQYDTGPFEELLEESDDLQSDAMATTKVQLEEMVELGKEHRQLGGIDPDETADFSSRRNGLLRKGLVGAGAATALGAAMLVLGQSAAFAATPTDIQILQTAASIENLAVLTYGVALTLPFIGGASANPVVKAFAIKTKSQHAQHAVAFNGALAQLGGKQQHKPDPKLLAVVEAAKPGLKTPGAVVDLAIELENGAAETYIANVGALSDLSAKKVTASIMGVEAQHVAILLAVKALLPAAPQDIALPPPVAKLPAAAGSVGFPAAFYSTTDARPATEGAVR